MNILAQTDPISALPSPVTITRKKETRKKIAPAFAISSVLGFMELHAVLVHVAARFLCEPASFIVFISKLSFKAPILVIITL